MATNKTKALALARLGMHVFPCREVASGNYDIKTPYTPNGFGDATTDASQINKWWLQHPRALVGVAAGKSGIVVLDIDVKRDDKGRIVVDGHNELVFEELPDTFNYPTLSGEGQHRIYRDPGDKVLGPNTDYRKLKGVDRRAGGSYAIWWGETTPKSWDEISPAPEWLLDENEVRTRAEFSGSVEDWFYSLVEGEPSVAVRRAMTSIPDDMSHSDMVSAQHEAIRLGAEGHPGVPQLLSALETAWLNRPAENHSTPESQWPYKFVEALESGIEKHGAAIELFKNLPPYNPSIVPAGVPDQLITSATPDKGTFSKLLASLVKNTDNDMVVLSVLWNCPTTKDLAREWGLEFVFNERIASARRRPEPVSDNPSLEQTVRKTPENGLLTDDERQYVTLCPTFIDEYIRKSYEFKGFVNPEFAVPAAWTALSAAFGSRAIVPANGKLPLNLWFIVFGGSGSGKTSENKFVRPLLDLLLKEPDSHWNVGGNSSPEAIHEHLLGRDNKTTVMFQDEAASFFSGLKSKDWMGSLEHQLSSYYDGDVYPETKLRIPKELRGKTANTIFNLWMTATPSKTLGYMHREMFDTGFLARANWGWDDTPERLDEDLDVFEAALDEEYSVPKMAYELAGDLVFATRWLPANKKVRVLWDNDAKERLVSGYRDMRKITRSTGLLSELEQSLTRLQETMWKCAALLALYRGETTIRLEDAVIALYYVERWFNNLFKVYDKVGLNEFNRDCDLIEAYLATKPDGDTKTRIAYRFRGMMTKGPIELDLRLDALLQSGRIVREDNKYRVNGVRD